MWGEQQKAAWEDEELKQKQTPSEYSGERGSSKNPHNLMPTAVIQDDP